MPHSTKTIKIEFGDIVLDGSGRLATVTGGEYATQSIRDACKVRRGELSYDTQQGLDFEAIYSIDVKSNTDESIGLAIRECLLNNNVVSEVSGVSIIRNLNRSISATINVVLTSGEQSTEVINLG